MVYEYTHASIFTARTTYIVGPALLSFDNAVNYCKGRYANLVTVESSEKTVSFEIYFPSILFCVFSSHSGRGDEYCESEKHIVFLDKYQ